MQPCKLHDHNVSYFLMKYSSGVGHKDYPTAEQKWSKRIHSKF